MFRSTVDRNLEPITAFEENTAKTYWFGPRSNLLWYLRIPLENIPERWQAHQWDCLALQIERVLCNLIGGIEVMRTTYQHSIRFLGHSISEYRWDWMNQPGLYMSACCEYTVLLSPCRLKIHGKLALWEWWRIEVLICRNIMLNWFSQERAHLQDNHLLNRRSFPFYNCWNTSDNNQYPARKNGHRQKNEFRLYVLNISEDVLKITYASYLHQPVSKIQSLKARWMFGLTDKITFDGPMIKYFATSYVLRVLTGKESISLHIEWKSRE